MHACHSNFHTARTSSYPTYTVRCLLTDFERPPTSSTWQSREVHALHRVRRLTGHAWMHPQKHHQRQRLHHRQRNVTSDRGRCAPPGSRSAVHAAGRLRISVRLVDALRDEHVWAHQYEERNTNLTEARLARTAARELGAALTSAADAVDAGDQADPLAASARMGVVARAR